MHLYTIPKSVTDYYHKGYQFQILLHQKPQVVMLALLLAHLVH